MQKMRTANNVCELIGYTPIVKLNRVVAEGSADVYLKLENNNPGGSIKDRIALSMLEDAEKRGLLGPGSVIIEPTSGNTGIGLAMIAAAKGYKAILVMPDTMSMERRKLLQIFGAELILTDGELGMIGAIEKAEELVSENTHYYMPQQFTNMANPEAHYEQTGKELLEQMDNNIDAFVAGVGTGGTITGIGRILKERIKRVAIYAVEPMGSPVLTGGKPANHKIQGIGAGFIPEVLDTKIYDKVLKVENKEAIDMARNLAAQEGLLLGISSGANVVAALHIAKKLGANKRVVTIASSTGERYLSTEMFDFTEQV